MAGTNNLLYKNDRPFMGPIETSDDVFPNSKIEVSQLQSEHYGHPHKSTR